MPTSDVATEYFLFDRETKQFTMAKLVPHGYHLSPRIADCAVTTPVSILARTGKLIATWNTEAEAWEYSDLPPKAEEELEEEIE